MLWIDSSIVVGFRKDKNIHELHQHIEELRLSCEGKVDKQIIKHIVLGYFTAANDKRHEVERLLARILDFNREEMQKANILIGNESWKKQEALDSSLSEQFVHFLEEESKPTLKGHMSLSSKELAKDLAKSLTSSVGASIVGSTGSSGVGSTGSGVLSSSSVSSGSSGHQHEHRKHHERQRSNPFLASTSPLNFESALSVRATSNTSSTSSSSDNLNQLFNAPNLDQSFQQVFVSRAGDLDLSIPSSSSLTSTPTNQTFKSTNQENISSKKLFL